MNAQDFAAREMKFAPARLETVSRDGVFEGYASLFDTLDLGRDRVRPGAFRRSLQAGGVGAVRMLYQHDPKEPIGVWEEIGEDQKGLFVRGRLLPEIRRASEVMTLMRMKALDGLSIGFKARRARRIRGGSARELLELDLYEISVVTFPMHPAARAAMVEAAQRPASITKGLPTVRQFERWLTSEAGFTRRQARLAIANGFKSLALTPDAEPARQKESRPAASLRRAARTMRAAIAE